VGVSKFPQLRLWQLWGRITLRENLWLWWGLKQSCSPCQDLFNSMSQCAYTLGNQVDSKLLVVGSQTTSLTPGLLFGHNSCFRHPNGWCKPISNIYVSIFFQWHKELFKPMHSDPWNCILRFGSPLGLQLPTWSSLGSVRVHSLTLFGTPGSMKSDS
jgi:hypothetical protein